MNQVPPPADLSKLRGILGNAKAVMNKVNNGNFSTGYVDSSALVQDTSQYVSEGNVPVNNGATSMGNPARQMGTPNKDVIMKSKLPEHVKKAMIENPIPQANMNHTFNLEDVSDLIQDEKPMPPPQARTQRNVVNEGMMRNQSNGMITVNESDLRNMIKDVLIEYLTGDYQKNLTEGVIKKTINTLIKEGKIKTKVSR